MPQRTRSGEHRSHRAEARALVAENGYLTAQEKITALHQPGGKVRWRERRALREAQDQLDTVRLECDRLRTAAAQARSIATAFRQDTETAVADLAAQALLSREEVQRRGTVAEEAQTRLDDLEQAQLDTLDRLAGLRADHDAALTAEKLVATCTRRGWPHMHAQATTLRREVMQDNSRRRKLEERHESLQQQYERLSRDAQGEIIRAAQLVATTLASARPKPFSKARTT